MSIEFVITDDFVETNKNINEIRKLKSAGVVTTETIKFLDQLAEDLYQDPKLWYILAIYNNIIDPFNIPMQLQYPSKDDVNKFMFSVGD